MKLIPKTDSRYFELSSDQSYDRHNYVVDLPDGRSLIFEDYEEMRAIWFQHFRNWEGCIVTVIDKDAKKESRTNAKGFGD